MPGSADPARVRIEFSIVVASRGGQSENFQLSCCRHVRDPFIRSFRGRLDAIVVTELECSSAADDVREQAIKRAGPHDPCFNSFSVILSDRTSPKQQDVPTRVDLLQIRQLPGHQIASVCVLHILSPCRVVLHHQGMTNMGVGGQALPDLSVREETADFASLQEFSLRRFCHATLPHESIRFFQLSTVHALPASDEGHYLLHAFLEGSLSVFSNGDHKHVLGRPRRISLSRKGHVLFGGRFGDLLAGHYLFWDLSSVN